MDSASLVMLVEIVDAGSISEAARRLKVTRANVSYHLKQLEASVGEELIRRTTRNLEPTELGLRLYEHGRVIKDSLDSAQETVASLDGTPRGRVRLSVPNGYGQLVMTAWLLEFKQRFPGVVLDVVFENRIQDLIRDEVDVAVRLLSEPPANLEWWDLGSVGIVACATPAFVQRRGLPSHPEELPQFPVVTASMLAKRLRVAAYRAEERIEVSLEPTLTSHNFLFLRDAIRADIGVGLVADYLVAEEIAAGAMVAALDQWRLSMFGDRVYLLTMPSRHRSGAITSLLEHLAERAGAASSSRAGSGAG
ncbi:LysR family transcriptional regulator [Granulicoccus phenolivorans]|uniref:LysR family transcriptional regulator n=1 Tax=Granulicoccus phenolivorans TaxID=266854 RepID=UPI0003FEDE27|nr:LysR family transcriptional regulator [Granulicoccus phenolivorans]